MSIPRNPSSEHPLNDQTSQAVVMFTYLFFDGWFWPTAISTGSDEHLPAPKCTTKSFKTYQGSATMHLHYILGFIAGLTFLEANDLRSQRYELKVHTFNIAGIYKTLSKWAWIPVSCHPNMLICQLGNAFVCAFGAGRYLNLAWRCFSSIHGLYSRVWNAQLNQHHPTLRRICSLVTHWGGYWRTLHREQAGDRVSASNSCCSLLQHGPLQSSLPCFLTLST